MENEEPGKLGRIDTQKELTYCVDQCLIDSLLLLRHRLRLWRGSRIQPACCIIKSSEGYDVDRCMLVQTNFERLGGLRYPINLYQAQKRQHCTRTRRHRRFGLHFVNITKD